VAARCQENAEGEETAWEAVAAAYPKGKSSATAVRRTDSGEERKAERGESKEVKFLGPEKDEDLKDQPLWQRSKRERRNPMTSLVFSGLIL
jgi:hypothetical protein